MKIYIKTLNICPMRKVNINRYKNALSRGGHKIVQDAHLADKVLVWTCGVRGDFHKNSCKVLSELSLDHEVIAAGCLPSIDPNFVNKEFKGDVLPWNSDNLDFRKLFDCDLEGADFPLAEPPLTQDIDAFRRENPDYKIGNDDQYTKLFIAEGCTRKCTYCTEILAFPVFASYLEDKIVQKAKEIFSRTGASKIALFGDDIGAYGSDSGRTLIDLIENLLKVDSSIQISLKQIHPLAYKAHFDPIKDFILDQKIFQILCPIQSASDRILKLMGRGHNKEDLYRLFSIADLAPHLELETHVIAGFPSETAAEWHETVDFVCEFRFRYVMGNIFMPGVGTLAATMPDQISDEEKAKRILTGAEKMEQHGVIVGHDLNWRSKEHIEKKRFDLSE